MRMASAITMKMESAREIRMRHMDLMSAGMDGIIRMAAETDLRMALMGTDMVMAAGKAGKDRR